MSIYRVQDLHRPTSIQDHGALGWLPARNVYTPFRWRVRAAWMVLTGKADAVVWPNANEG